MRFFNTEGPARPDDHYAISPSERMDVDELLGLIRSKRYFVLHTLRQTGKTSALIALRDLLKRGEAGDFRCVSMDVESAQVTRDDMARGIRAILNALAAAFLWAALAAAGPAHADSRAVEQFLDRHLEGCVRHGGARGQDRLRGHAWCVCAVAQFRMEGSEAALEELARRVVRGEPVDGLEIFNRAARNRQQCDAVGTHDAGPPDRLERSRNFGPFTIALPPGFLLLNRSTAPAGASYGFHRLHEDLRSAATLQVVIRRASKEGRAGSGDADEFRLRGLLDELARTRSNFRVVETGEAAAGNLRFKRARWQAAEAGDPMIGEVYAGGSGDAVVLIRLQDRERLASRTMPAMRAALATLRLR